MYLCVYDLISFDYAKAFDKAPHAIDCVALVWLASFLADRTFCARVGNHYSSTAKVTSSIIQGCSLGPILYYIFIDSLVHKINLPSQAFADDFKFLADVVVHSRPYIQSQIDVAADWADEHGTPLSVEKSLEMHCGTQ